MGLFGTCRAELRDEEEELKRLTKGYKVCLLCNTALDDELYCFKCKKHITINDYRYL